MVKLDPPPAALRLDIDRAALTSNWQTLDRLSGSACAGAAVKADAYGVGARIAVPLLWEAGCRDFFVTYASEAADIIDLVPPDSISLLHGPLRAADATWARASGVRLVINSLEQARRWIDSGGGLCDVMVDSGINRLGLPMSALGDEMVQQLEVDVLMSHLASADEDVASNSVQCARWNEARSSLQHRRASLANSAGIVLGEAYHGALTRPGLSLYGGIARSELAHEIRQVARPMAAIMQVRQIAAGEGVGYNSTFIAPAAMQVGVIALGYADGYLRCWSGGKGAMLHEGRRLPVLGRVSMDMTVVDLADAPELREGDWIEADYGLVEGAAASGLSQYELLTLLGRRFAR
ncbi:MAG: alanine racemase [Novosphingobium sp.]